MAITSTTGPVTGVNIVAYRGDTFERWLRIQRNGTEEDLSADTFLMQIRNATGIVYTLDLTFGGLIFDSPNNGVLKMFIAASNMRDLPVGVYDYDLEQTYALSQIVKTRIRGSFTITKDITIPIA